MYRSAGDILLKHKDARYFAELGVILHQDRRLDTVEHVDNASRQRATMAAITPTMTAT